MLWEHSDPNHEPTFSELMQSKSLDSFGKLKGDALMFHWNYLKKLKKYVQISSACLEQDYFFSIALGIMKYNAT